MPPPPGPGDLPAILRTFLAAEATLSLATVDERGRPHAANVNFVADDRLDLYWVSSPDSAHSRHLERRPDVAVTCYARFRGPDELRGVQIHGRATPRAAEEFEPNWARFTAKFPYATQFEELVRSGRITGEDAFAKAEEKARFTRYVKDAR